MNSDPYESPRAANVLPAAPSAGSSTHLFLLGTGFVVTFLLALANSIGEQLPTLSFVAGATVAAVISQLPGIAVAIMSSRRVSRLTTTLLFPAYFVAATGLLAYLAYAFNGKADSLNSAAHMHVIVFPVLHCIVAIVTYIVASFVFGILGLVLPKR